MIWGKVIGALAGLAVGRSVLSMLAGAIVGHWIDSWLAKAYPNREWLRRGQVFAEAVTIISAKLSKVDGPVSREEVDCFKAQFRFGDHQKALVARVFDEAKKDPYGFEDSARSLHENFAEEPFLLAEVFGAFYRIAAVDGGPNAEEQIFLERVARLMGLSYQSYSEPPRRPEVGSKDPYVILNVSRSATMSEIKAAWRKLSREHHPDGLIAKGVPEDYVKMATKKMADINAAYDQIRAERGET